MKKCHENGSNGSGDMEQTRNSRVNPLTLTCDLVLRMVAGTCAVHTVLLRGTNE